MDPIKQLVSLGKQCFDQKQYKKAEHYFRKVIMVNKNYADVFNMLGVIHHIEGKFTSAVEYFKKAIKINPRYTEALLNLAVLFNDLGQYAQARKLYSQLKQGPSVGQRQIEPVLRGKLSNLHSDIGEIYRSVGLYEYAIEEYKKALNLNPNYYDIRTRLGQAYRENGKLTLSLKELKSVLDEKNSYSPARVQLGVTLYSQGKQGEAQREWKKVLSSDPRNEYAKMYLRLCEAQKIAKQRQSKTTKPINKTGPKKKKTR